MGYLRLQTALVFRAISRYFYGCASWNFHDHILEDLHVVMGRDVLNTRSSMRVLHTSILQFKKFRLWIFPFSIFTHFFMVLRKFLHIIH